MEAEIMGGIGDGGLKNYLVLRVYFFLIHCHPGLSEIGPVAFKPHKYTEYQSIR
jgi:hypothetical protein